MTGLTPVGRLALRVEGGFWNAYYVLPEMTSRDGVLLGSISMAFLDSATAGRGLAFRLLMQDIVSDLIEHATGTRPVWPDPPQPAPESERSGNA